MNGDQVSKTFRRRLVAAAVASCFTAGTVLANPTNPTVVNGQVSILQNGNLLQVTNSPNSIINWQSFSIGANEITRIIQQSHASAVLNRVVGSGGAIDPSVILGALQSNGRVLLVNPSGILFGAGAQIDVAGLIATSLNISNADFLANKLKFTDMPGAGSVVNQGNITTGQGGQVYLVGPAVTNSGIITTPKGEVVLAAGNSVELVNPGTPNLRVEITAPDNAAKNLGSIIADSGRIGIYAGLINHSGTIRADSVSVTEDGRIVLKATKIANLEAGSVTSASGAVGGLIEIQADVLVNSGGIHADGAQGGSVAVQARNFLSAGRISADGAQGAGGEVNVQASGRIVQTSRAHLSADGATGGGKVTLQAADRVFGSGTLTATGQGAGSTGGEIRVLGNEIVLLGASLDASGDAGGGTVLVGGDFQGNNPAVQNAATNQINFSTTIKVDARTAGDGGKVIVWSDQETQFYGSISARGGAQSGDGGFIEVSGKENLVFGGMADAGAPNGTPGTLLLDPKFIVIDSAGGGLASFLLVDPNPGAGDLFGGFGNGVVVLPNDNVVATDPNDDLVAANAGAVYLFNGNTGALISTLSGSTADNSVGSGGVVALAGNGNYVVSSPVWDNGAATNAGAVTFGNGTTGVSGVVSAANSLVGSTLNDNVGRGAVDGVSGVTALTNGNYVVRSRDWDSGTVVNAGAVTFGNGTTGISGAVSASNSLVGLTLNDQVGTGVTALTNGNYVVSSPNWNGAAADVGAVTWVNGANGRVFGAASPGAAVSSSNSLVGSTLDDRVGGVTALTNGNYVVASQSWDGAAVDVGAVTWGNGNGGTVGTVSVANSLVGTTAFDRVGSNGVTALTNGHYVVGSPLWDGAAADVGAVTWGNGLGGTVGAVSAANSLVGTAQNDLTTDICGGGCLDVVVRALSNGNYVVISSEWNNGTILNVGAVTWGNGLGGTVGPVTALNSLIGAVAGDRIGEGGITGLNNAGDRISDGSIPGLSNGNFVVRSPLVDNGAIVDAGLVHVVVPPSSASGQTFAANPSGTATLTPAAITAITNTGTAVILQANTDITLASASSILSNNPGGNGGAITMQAGRSVLLNSNITTDNGALTLIANDTTANSVVNANRDSGAAVIAMAPGTTINAGSGNVMITLNNGAGLTNPTSGNITLANLTGGNVTVQNLGPTAGSSITALGGSAINAGTLTANAPLGDVDINAAVTASGNVNLVAGSHVRVNAATVSAGGAVSVNAPFLDITAAGASAQLKAGTDLTVNAGEVTLTGGTVPGAFAELRGGPGAFNVITTASTTASGDVLLTGGTGSGAYARIFGNPDVGSLLVPVSVGGVIQMTPGSGTDASASIESASPTSIYITFPNLTSGGYFVNGAEGVVHDSGTSSGFVAGTLPAVLNTNLLVTYGLTLPPAPPPPLPSSSLPSSSPPSSSPPPESGLDLDLANRVLIQAVNQTASTGNSAPAGQDEGGVGTGTGVTAEEKQKKALPICSK